MRAVDGNAIEQKFQAGIVRGFSADVEFMKIAFVRRGLRVVSFFEIAVSSEILLSASFRFLSKE